MDEKMRDWEKQGIVLNEEGKENENIAYFTADR